MRCDPAGAQPNNGVAARDLRLTLRTVYRPNTRKEGLASLVCGFSAAFLLHDDVEVRNGRTALGVHDLRQGQRVAERYFTDHREAGDVRQRFAEHVRSMSLDEYQTRNWQDEVDAFR